jgi:hypothetical protein
VAFLIILPVVLYGRETLSLTLSEEYTLRMSKNRLLRRIFGQRRDEVTESDRKLQNEKFSVTSCHFIIRMIKLWKMRWVGHTECVTEKINSCNILEGEYREDQEASGWIILESIER